MHVIECQMGLIVMILSLYRLLAGFDAVRQLLAWLRVCIMMSVQLE